MTDTGDIDVAAEEDSIHFYQRIARKMEQESGRIAAGVAAFVGGRFVGILSGLVLIPVMYQHLREEEIGIWFLLAQPAILLGIVDLGITPTVTRSIAMANAAGDHGRMGRLVGTTRRLLGCTSSAVLVMSLITAWLCCYRVELESISRGTLSGIWVLATIAYVIRLHASQFVGAVTGVGRLAATQTVDSVGRLVGTLVKVVSLVMGGGLVAIVAIDLVIAAAYWFGCRRQWIRHRPAGTDYAERWCGNVFRQLRPLAFRDWLTTLGAFMILQTDQLFIAFYLGPAEISDYRCNYLLLQHVNKIGLAATFVSVPILSRAWARSDLASLHRSMRRNLSLSMTSMICGAVMLVGCGDSLMHLWIGPGHFIGFRILIVFATLFVLESHYVVFAAAVRATGDEAFAAVALIAGVINLVLTAVLVQRFGLLGVAAATLIAQLLTNNWYAVWRAHHRIGFGLRRHLTMVVPGYLTVLGVAATGATLIRRQIGDSPSTAFEHGIFCSATFAWCALVASCTLMWSMRSAARTRASGTAASDGGRDRMNPPETPANLRGVDHRAA